MHSVANQCKSYYGLKRLARNEVKVYTGNIVNVTILSIGGLPSVFIFIIHLEFHTLAHCIRYLARRLFIRELFMFDVMNNTRAILSL